MIKTVHSKSNISKKSTSDIQHVHISERNLIKKLTQELMQPRHEAVMAILQKAKLSKC